MVSGCVNTISLRKCGLTELSSLAFALPFGADPTVGSAKDGPQQNWIKFQCDPYIGTHTTISPGCEPITNMPRMRSLWHQQRNLELESLPSPPSWVLSHSMNKKKNSTKCLLRRAYSHRHHGYRREEGKFQSYGASISSVSAISCYWAQVKTSFIRLPCFVQKEAFFLSIPFYSILSYPLMQTARTCPSKQHAVSHWANWEVGRLWICQREATSPLAYTTRVPVS